MSNIPIFIKDLLRPTILVGLHYWMPVIVFHYIVELKHDKRWEIMEWKDRVNKIKDMIRKDDTKFIQDLKSIGIEITKFEAEDKVYI